MLFTLKGLQAYIVNFDLLITAVYGVKKLIFGNAKDDFSSLLKHNLYELIHLCIVLHFHSGISKVRKYGFVTKTKKLV